MKGVYNKKIKVAFLSNYPESTQATYYYYFLRISNMESLKEKDLYEFSIIDIEELMKSLSLNYVGMVRSIGTFISSYIKWCIENDIKKTDNPLVDYKTEWFEQFVINEDAPIRWTCEEIYTLSDLCENAQDAVILLFAFEGITGLENAEMRNLKKTDIIAAMDNNTLQLTDADGSQRTIEVSEKCTKTAMSAAKEDIYLKNNGLMMLEPSNIRPFTDLINNDYVIRSSKTNTFELGPVNKYVIYRRVAVIAESYNVGELNIKNIARSGMIYYGKCLMEEHGQLGKKQLLLIAEKFKMKSLHMVKTIVNEKSIKQLYL